MLQPPEQPHEAKGVGAGQGSRDVEVVSLRERVGPGHTLHTLMEIFQHFIILLLAQWLTSILSITLSGLRLPSLGSSTVMMTTFTTSLVITSITQQGLTNLIYTPGNHLNKILLLDDRQKVSHVLR